MKQIPLTKNKTALVDDEDYDFLNQWKWYFNCGYANRKENGKHFAMHTAILKTTSMVDHINGDGLDNRRCNLRTANHSTNAMNMRKHRGSSIYKGVTLEGNTWRTTIWKDSKPVLRITMPNERWAAMAYDLNAAALFGEYARLNFEQVVKTADELHG